MIENTHYNPVILKFGEKAIENLGEIAAQYGTKCLLVGQNDNPPMKQIFDKTADILKACHMEVISFTSIRPNPLSKDIDEGISLVQNNKFDFIVAIGGGSVIDSAKILSFSNEYEINWESMFNPQILKENSKKLPLIAITTTSGTGSQCTQASVVSDLTNQKHTIFSYDFFPTVAIIDHTLTMTLPKTLTSSTAFDAFCHLSESYINGRFSCIDKLMAIEGMKKIAYALPKLMIENNLKLRRMLSEADVYAGISLSNGGATVPHFFGEKITSNAMKVNHGCSLAIVYPSYMEHYYDNKEVHNNIKDVLEIINLDNIVITNGKDAKRVMERFLELIQLPSTLGGYGVNEDELLNFKNDLLKQTRFSGDSIDKIIADICIL